jgi:hypothetical protein
MPLARGDKTSDAASCVTFDGSTRLRTERPASSLAPAVPEVACFQQVSQQIPKVAGQFPIGDDVSTSSPCEAWPGFDFYRLHAAYPAAAGPTSACTRLYRIAFATPPDSESVV